MVENGKGLIDWLKGYKKLKAARAFTLGFVGGFGDIIFTGR